MNDTCRCPICEPPPTAEERAELERQEQEREDHADQTAEWNFCFERED